MSSAVPRILEPLDPMVSVATTRASEPRARGRYLRPIVGGALGWLACMGILAAAADPAWLAAWIGW